MYYGVNSFDLGYIFFFNKFTFIIMINTERTNPIKYPVKKIRCLSATILACAAFKSSGNPSWYDLMNESFDTIKVIIIIATTMMNAIIQVGVQ